MSWFLNECINANICNYKITNIKPVNEMGNVTNF